MKRKVSYLALFIAFALFVNSIVIQKPDRIVQSSSNILPSDSSSLRSHDIHPEFYFNELYPYQFEMQSLPSGRLTASVYPNINISKDSFPQNEPSVKISRKNPNIVVAAWRDFRTGVNPAVRRIGYSRSTDGGITWDISRLLPPHDPMHPRASDPAVCTDTSGNFYISTISLNNSNLDGIVVVYKSTNQGLSFDYSVSIASHTDTTQFDDKEYITCDLVPGSPYRNNIYVAWAGYDSMTACRSTDGGLSWSPRIHHQQIGGGTGLVPVVGAEGEVYIIWMGYTYIFGPGIYFNKSTNGGLNFSNDILVDSIVSSSFLRLPSIAVDISNGTRHGYIYAVWSNINPVSAGDEDVFFKYSSDRGSTWSARKRVNDDPPGNGKRQYWPWISVNEFGNIFIIYFDTRHSPSPWLEFLETYIAYSTNGGESFINEVLSTQQFSVTSPNFDVRFGDYIGIDSWGGKIVPVWTDQRAGGYNQEIYTAIIVDSLIGIKPIAGVIPKEFRLHQNYPNPFNPATIIKFEIPEQTAASLKIFDILGREVMTLIDAPLKAGVYSETWNAEGLSSGVYFYRLETLDFTETKKTILIK